MSSHDEKTPTTEISPVTLNEGSEQAAVQAGKKPFLEPTVSISLNILDATAFFQGSAALDGADI